MSPDTRIDRSGAPDGGSRLRPPATAALQERYRAYRLRQGRDLLSLMPRKGLRQVIQACRPRVGPGAPDVSLDDLADFCADLLPLPPLRAWMVDFQRNRAAHLADEAPGDAGPRSPGGEPVVVAVRHIRHQGRDWVGQLQVWPRDDRWEGAIQFHGDDDDRAWRTAPIFRESSVPAIRERFRIFDDHTVAAFLRSALP